MAIPRGIMSSQIRFERDGDVAIVTLSMPQRRNALSFSLLSDLRETVVKAERESTRALVLTGSGGVFSAGADLTEREGTAADVAIDDAVSATAETLLSLRIPVLAAVEGPCVGAAVDLALACDVIVASDSAWFAVPAVKLGLLYNPAAVHRWYKRVPGATLRRLLLFDERIEGESALTAGLVDRVAPSGTAVAECVRLAARAVPGDALAATRALLRSLDAGSFAESDWQGVRRDLLASDERRAALAARSKTVPEEG